MEIEFEKTYLAKSLPAGLKESKNLEMIDIYIPSAARHPVLRIRKRGDKLVMTKKQPIKEGDASIQSESSIILTPEEYKEINDSIKGKRTHKIRYYYDYNGKVVEFDVFQGALKGLVVIDFEFDNAEDKDAFEKELPEFCLADVTQEEFIAGGMVCGKSYEDLVANLNRFGYKKLELE